MTDKETAKKNIIKAGKIHSEIKEWIRPQIKKGTLLLEIAEKIEAKIFELGGEIAFPVNLSINEVAAHYTPTHNDESVAHGLLKVDFGVHIDGWIADSAFSLDLEDTELNRKLIKASQEAVEAVESVISSKTIISEVGRVIEEKIKENRFNPVVNLSGHMMDQYDLHAGATIPNIDNGSDFEFGEGLFAVEPFATDGNGKVHDGAKGNIYILQSGKNVRHPGAREVLEYIKDNYGSLPFASRWLVKELGIRALFGLRQLENENVIHHYSMLVEEKGKLVSQAENTFLIEKDKIIVTSKEY